LLTALVQPGCESSRIKLAVHAVLSNPLPPDEQVSLLTGLCSGPYRDLLPAVDRLTLIDELNEQRPSLAVAFCSLWLETHPDISREENPIHHSNVRDIDQLAEIMFQIHLHEIAGKSKLPADLITAENSITNSLYAGLVTRILSHTPKSLSPISSTHGLSDSSEKAINILGFTLPIDYNPARQAELALTRCNQGFIEQAISLIPHRWTTPDNGSSVCIARISSKMEIWSILMSLFRD
jgi:hypothetical protein